MADTCTCPLEDDKDALSTGKITSRNVFNGVLFDGRRNILQLSAKSSLSKCLDYHTPIRVPENYGLNLIFAFRVNLIWRKNQRKQEIKGYQQKNGGINKPMGGSI